ncbi:HAD-IA family hydrolase [Govanella unica]|uniref:HAD-IA family hydrolase n=1 Tax=Govanella unica TaxID=2975056 RepID=A0A9X3TW80_9PROT|nr:HAD-IA family hydrolase [Govania unica]
MDCAGFLVFDCDGTIVDSQFMIIAAMNEAFDGVGLTRPDNNNVRRVVGLSLPEAISRLLGEADQLAVADLAERYKRAFRRAREDGGREPFYPGAREAIIRFSEAGYLLGVATGKSRRGLLAVLEQAGIRSHFVSLQTADDAPGKPHPAMLRQAMADAGASADETLMIGDTSYDIDMARAAGVVGLGVSWGYHAPQDLITAGAVRVVDDYPALERAVPELLINRVTR